MTEDVLQYIWKIQAIDKSSLRTTQGASIKIIQQGNHNFDEGPDFSSARIIIDEVDWVGDVEIHVNSRQWVEHNHHNDTAYNRVILHVVWEDDSDVKREDGTRIPTLELKDIVADYWLQRYHMLMSSLQTIPCQSYLPQVDDLYKYSAFSNALVKRLERKSEDVLNNLAQTNGDWEQAAITILIENFGFKKNKDGFIQLASCIDYKIIRKLSSITQTEAYLFGMAGLLPRDSSEQYIQALRKEFSWIRTKFNITRDPMSSTWWIFMRMRPANFPTLRIAQLAQVLHSSRPFLRSVLEMPLPTVNSLFSVEQSEFWQNHYHFSKPSTRNLKGLGMQTAALLSINVAAVMLMAYGRVQNNNLYIDRAIKLLEALPAEENSITTKWANLGIKLQNAAESQGAVELFNNYCKKAGCLSCPVGSKILQNT